MISPTEAMNPYTKKGYTGLPQNLIINEDGIFTVVSEEITVATTTGMYSSSTSTTLGDIAVVNYNKTGEFISEHLVRKSQIIYDRVLHPFYLSYRDGTAQSLLNGSQFKSFSYLNGKSKNFILFNDTERNNDKQESGSLVTVNGVSASDAFYYPLNVTSIVPKRDYVFGDMAGKKNHILGLFSISDYNRANNIYTTLKLENISEKSC